MEALLLLDLQFDFLDPKGRMPIDQSQVPGLLHAAHSAVSRARTNGIPIVAVGNEFGKHDILNLFRNFASLEGEPGSRWDPRAPTERDAYFPKRQTDAFSNPDLGSWLSAHNIHLLRICGLRANACVSATAKSALRRGLEVVVAEEETGCLSNRSRRKALARLEKAGAAIAWKQP